MIFPGIKRELKIIACALAALPALTGCRTAAQWRNRADQAAYGAIEKTRRSEFGDAEPFTIETPENTFRRRLIETQNLPVSDVVMLGSKHLPGIPGWKQSFLPEPDEKEQGEGIELSGEPPELSLADALRIAALNSPEYQTRKETLFLTALDLDLAAEDFRNTFAGMLSGETGSQMSGDDRAGSAGASGSLSASRVFTTGAKVAASLALDLVRLLTAPQSSALGLQFDSSVTIPLGRGAGRLVASESLTQAQQNLLYAVWEFEYYKASFAVETASKYLRTLAREDTERNSAENYRRLSVNAQRARRLAAAGRLPELQVDQAEQERLRAWNRWLSARKQSADEMDNFKLFLGLPVDARIRLQRGELDALAVELREKLPMPADADAGAVETESGKTTSALPEPDAADAGPMEMPETGALALALENRLDLRATLGRVRDAQRKIIVAADALGADVSLLGQAKIGERRSAGGAGQGNADFDLDRGAYTALLKLDLPFKRTSERNAFRKSIVTLEQGIRQAREAEDRIKLQVRANLSALTLARDSLRIQSEAARIAARRVSSSDMFLDAGRAEVRDVLEAQDALLSAENALTAAVIDYRLSELELRKNLGLLNVGGDGLWIEAPEDGAGKQQGDKTE